MTRESRSIGARVASIARQRLGKHSRGNEHARNNKRTTVYMQRRGKHTTITVEKKLENGVFY
jgi:hypothetical protein